MKILKKHIFIFIALILLLSSISYCGYKINAKVSFDNYKDKANQINYPSINIKEYSKYYTIKQNGKFKAGVRYNRNYWAWKDENGNFQGFEIDILKKIAEYLNLEVEFVPMDFENTFPYVTEGIVDVAAAIVTHKIEREENVDFSLHYFMEKEIILINKNLGINSIEDLIKAGMKVAVSEGDSVSSNLKKLYPEIKLFKVTRSEEKYQAVEDGLAQAIAGDYVNLAIRKRNLLKNPEQYIILKETISTAPIAMVLPENESDWRDAINYSINLMFKNGDYYDIFNKWFGEESELYLSDYDWKPILIP